MNEILLWLSARLQGIKEPSNTTLIIPGKKLHSSVIDRTGGRRKGGQRHGTETSRSEMGSFLRYWDRKKVKATTQGEQLKF